MDELILSIEVTMKQYVKIIIGFICVILNAVFMIVMGYISDGYPSDSWFDGLATLQWISFVLSIIVTVILFIMTINDKKSARGKVYIVLFNIILILSCALTILSGVGTVYMRDKYPYISSEQYNNINR